MRSPVIVLVAVAAAAVAWSPEVRAQVANPVFGQVSRDCVNTTDIEAAGGELFGVKTDRGYQVPDVLFDAHASGGPTVLADLSGDTYLVPGRWRSTPNIHSRVAVVISLPGEALIELSDFSTLGEGASRPQPVGTIDGTRPGVTATSWGYEVRFHPLLQQTPDLALNCAIAGSPATDHRPIIGYAVYRLPGTGNPALSQFRTAGYLGFLDARTLEFDVVETDGLGCADGEPADEGTILNPNGILDDGDEILVFRDVVRTPSGRLRANAPDPRQSFLYRLQPILGGDPAFFDVSGAVADTAVPANSVDRDGNGTRESIDIQLDGRYELIDPGRHGLGLTYQGEILSSPQPGQATPGPAPADPDADGIPSSDETAWGLDPTVSNATLDSDGDGPLDLLEVQSGADPLAADTDGSGERDGREMFYGRSPSGRCDDIVLGARVLGDVAPVGGDGVVNVADAVRMLRLAVNIETATELEVTLGDVGPAELSDSSTNPPTWRRHGSPDGLGQHPYGYFEHGDGVLDVADAVVILRQSVGLLRVTE